MSIILNAMPYLLIWFTGIAIGGLLASLVPPQRWERRRIA
jgi:uncharacterized membrane protein YraQ (UPF0718 family)